MMKKGGSFTVDEIRQKLEYYCAYQDRCHKEVEEKIRGYNLIPEAREMILLHLIQNNYLNEERFARSFARGKFRIKKWGRKRIVQELKFRDISAFNINSALQEIDPEEYLHTLEMLARKKYEAIGSSDSFKKRQKLYQYLYNRGYETDLISKSISNLMDSET